MKKHSSQPAIFLVVIIILAVALGLIIVLGKINEYGKSVVSINNHKHTEELVELINQYDISIYYLGTAPQDLDGLNEHIIKIGNSPLNENNMPVRWSTVHFEEYDTDGNLINEVETRDYPQYMFIVVAPDYIPTESDLEILRNCAVENNVPFLIIGDTNINLYRDHILVGPWNYGENGSMYFDGSVFNAGPDFTNGTTDREASDAIMELIIEHFGFSNEVSEDGN